MRREEEALRKEIMEAQAAYEAALSAEEAERLAQQNQNNVAGSGSSSNVTLQQLGLRLPAARRHRQLCDLRLRLADPPHLGRPRGSTSGVDLAASQGTPIYAIAAGTVTTATYGDANGYYVAHQPRQRLRQRVLPYDQLYRVRGRLRLPGTRSSVTWAPPAGPPVPICTLRSMSTAARSTPWTISRL